MEVLEDPQRQMLTIIGHQRDLKVFCQLLQGLWSVLAHLNQLLDAVIRGVLLLFTATIVDRVHIAEDALEVDDDQ